MVQNPPTDDVQIRIEQFLTLAGVLDMKEFLSGWFMNVPYELLTRDDVLSFVAYGFWCVHLMPGLCACLLSEDTDSMHTRQP